MAVAGLSLAVACPLCTEAAYRTASMGPGGTRAGTVGGSMSMAGNFGRVVSTSLTPVLIERCGPSSSPFASNRLRRSSSPPRRAKLHGNLNVLNGVWRPLIRGLKVRFLRDSPTLAHACQPERELRLASQAKAAAPSGATHRPWQLHVTIESSDQPRAIAFERYLKSLSGRAFAKRHFE